MVKSEREQWEKGVSSQEFHYESPPEESSFASGSPVGRSRRCSCSSERCGRFRPAIASSLTSLLMGGVLSIVYGLQLGSNDCGTPDAPSSSRTLIQTPLTFTWRGLVRTYSAFTVLIPASSVPPNMVYCELLHSPNTLIINCHLLPSRPSRPPISCLLPRVS